MLVHWPVPNKHVEAYIALEECKKLGLVKSIGISNYTIEDYVELMDSSQSRVKPVVNQMEVNPFLFRSKTIEFFQNEDILIQSYRSLCNGKAFENDILKKIAAKYDVTVGMYYSFFLSSLNRYSSY